MIRGTINVDDDLDHHADCPIGNLATTQQIHGLILIEISDYYRSAMIQGTNVVGIICITMLTLQIKSGIQAI